MPPKTPHDRGDGEQTEKRSRKAVDRLSSSKLTAKQYSPLGLLLVDKADSAVERSHQVCLDTSPHAQVTTTGDRSLFDSQVCHRCKRADHEDKMLLCDFCNKGWHLFCLNPPLKAIPEGDWSCPDCTGHKGKKKRESISTSLSGASPDATTTNAASTGHTDIIVKKSNSLCVLKPKFAAENLKDSSDTASTCTSNTNSLCVAGAASSGETAKMHVAASNNVKWSRPIRDEGLGGGWMVGRRVQVWCDKEGCWRDGNVEAIDALDSRLHSVLYEGNADPAKELVNLSKVRWRLDRLEDNGDHSKAGRLAGDSGPSASSSLPTAKRRPGRPKYCHTRVSSPQKAAAPVAAVVGGGGGEFARVPAAVPSARAVDPNACKEAFRKKLEMLHEVLEDTPVYVAVGGARAKKGRREGTLEYSRSQEKLMVRSGSKLESLDAFVEAVVGQQDRPKEHVFLSKNDEPLVEYETTLSGYGRPKLVDGTRVRLAFDNDDWYSGEVIDYDPLTARYRLRFDDGEEAEARHALFEPDEGFFVDNGKDCGMIFRNRASTLCKAALAAEDDDDKNRWRAPHPGEEAGGEWLVGKRIRIYWQFDSKFHEAAVEEYDPDPKAVDTRENVGPVHRVRYEESKQVYPENLTKCVWNIDKNEVYQQPAQRNSSNKGSNNSSATKHGEIHANVIAEDAVPAASNNNSAEKGSGSAKGKCHTTPTIESSEVRGGLSALVNEGECMWTAPHWKFKTGGAWLVGRKIKLYWDAERQWFAGRVLSYNASAHAQDSHGNVGPVHEVYYDDGIFLENLTSARWKLDANEGPSGNPIVHEWEQESESKKRQHSKELTSKTGGKKPEVDPNGREHSDKRDVMEDGVEEQKSAEEECCGSESIEDLTGDTVKCAKLQSVNDKDRQEKQPRTPVQERPDTHYTRKHGSQECLDTRISLPGCKIVLKLAASGEVGDASGDGKRSRDVAAPQPDSKRAKKLKHEEAGETVCEKTTGDAVAGNAGVDPHELDSDDVSVARLKMEGRRWTTPDIAHKNGGAWLLDRCVRLYWDQEAHWFSGIVVDFDGREDAEDSHGSIGPMHTIIYEDGKFLENLGTAKWQFDAKEGLAGVNIHGVREDPQDKVPEQKALGDMKSGSRTVEDAEGTKTANVSTDNDKVEERGGKCWRSECEKLLGRLMRQESAIPFLEPVDPVAMNLPDYFDFIKKPMDLGTVKSKLEQNRYTEPAQVLKDIVLCFDNAIEYNPASEPAHKLANQIKASFTSLCNGSQLLRPVLRILDLSRRGNPKGDLYVPKKVSSPIKSPVKKKVEAALLEAEGINEVSVAKSDDKCKSETVASKASEEAQEKLQENKANDQPAQAAKRGGPRMAANNAAAASCAPEEGVSEFRLKIQTKGRLWTTPTASFCQGGKWLVGRHIQVYWDDDKTWFPGVVTFYDSKPTAKDSHGNRGPVHDVYYEDGSFLENLGTAKWQYDAKEGPAGQVVDLGEVDASASCQSAPASEKKSSSSSSNVSSSLSNPRTACDDCRKKRIRCVHMAAAAVALGVSNKNSKEHAKEKTAGGGSTIERPIRQQVSSASMAAAMVAAGSPNKMAVSGQKTQQQQPLVGPGSPSKVACVAQKPLQLRGVKQDLTRKVVEYEIVYGHGKTQWTTGLNQDLNFRELLLAFIQCAFPDRSVLHPWMPDFKKHMWKWGYREKQLSLRRPEVDAQDVQGVVRVTGVQVVDGKTMYRTTMEKGNESKKQSCHEWHAVEEDTSLTVHKMAANFLFNVIGVLSLYMGRDKHAKFLRHLGAYEEYERGWEDFEKVGVSASLGVHGTQQGGIGIGLQDGTLDYGRGPGSNISFHGNGSDLPLFCDQTQVVCSGDSLLPMFENAQMDGDGGGLALLSHSQAPLSDSQAHCRPHAEKGYSVNGTFGDGVHEKRLSHDDSMLLDKGQEDGIPSSGDTLMQDGKRENGNVHGKDIALGNMAAPSEENVDDSKESSTADRRCGVKVLAMSDSVATCTGDTDQVHMDP